MVLDWINKIMGWNWNTRKQTKTEFVKELKSEITGLLKSRLTDNELWCLVQDGGHKLLVLCLLDKQDGCWGYKSMDEVTGPYFYNCPEAFLKETTVSNPVWRERYANHKKLLNRISKLKLGDSVFMGDWSGQYQYLRGAKLIVKHEGKLFSVLKQDVTNIVEV